MREHMCVGGKISVKPTSWVHDARGIPLAKVCDDCYSEKISKYRPEILFGYSQADVNESIEEDY